uniref:Sugar phosphate transporter domain-containing protein n=1 Tax=Daucus carota subsp. sativus TaxID=79200 RepID=A0A161WRW2_DAUCS
MNGDSSDGQTNKQVSFSIENSSQHSVNDAADLNSYNHAANSIHSHNLSVATKPVVSAAHILKTLFFILVWYTFSLLLTLYNKSLLGNDMGKFPAPLLMNTFHFGMQAVFARAITWIWSSRFQTTVKMSWKDYFMRVVPTALGTALDINLSNASLVFVTVTFATMCKSASPIFLLLFAFAFRLESPSAKLFGIILVISVGILFTGWLLNQFICCKGNRIPITGIHFCHDCCCYVWLSLDNDSNTASGLQNPLMLMSFIAPVMAVSTGILSLIFEPWSEFGTNVYFNSSWHITRSCLLLLLGGTLAFFMVLTEYILVSVTSAVTVTIAGVVKEVVTILVAVIYFHDEFTWMKGCGLIIIIIGVSLFNWYKYQKLQKGESSEDDMSGSLRTNVPAKYVILEENDDQDAGI